MYINELKLIIHNGYRAITKAVENSFEGIIRQQDCIFYKLQNISNAVKDKNPKSQILNDTLRVYKSKDHEGYEFKSKRQLIDIMTFNQW